MAPGILAFTAPALLVPVAWGVVAALAASMLRVGANEITLDGVTQVDFV